MAGMPYPPTKTPTDCTDVHRLGGKTQPKNLCASVQSVGGSYLPEGSVGSACSVGDSYLKLCWCSGDRCTPWCYCKPFTSSIGKPEP